MLGDDTPELASNDESHEILVERDKNKCLKGLSDNERELIALKQTNNYQEISDDLGIKTGTLRQQLARAREKFIKCMGWAND